MPEMDWEAVKTEYVTTNISKTKLAKLTEEQIAIAEQKGWNLA